MTAARHRAPVEHHPVRTGGLALAAMFATSGPITVSQLAPTVAEAAPSGGTWDDVARCESSGNWHIQTGNGYGGGLQFTDSTWHAFGGTGEPENASREQQITVAERVLAGQGRGAWPVCARGLASTAAARGAGSSPSSTASRTSTPAPSQQRATPRRAPAVPDQPRNVQEAVAASGPTNPACQALRRRGVPVGQLDQLDRAHPELHLDGNGNGVPCDVTYPRATSSSAPSERIAATPAPSAGRHSAPAVAAAGNGVIATARTWIGVDYLFGGNTRAGIDCSGLVQRVFAANGTALPRTADAQMRATQRISASQARPGDLVFGVTGGRAHHVGIYLGGGQMIDAPQSGSTVGVHRLYRDMTTFGRVR